MAGERGNRAILAIILVIIAAAALVSVFSYGILKVKGTSSTYITQNALLNRSTTTASGPSSTTLHGSSTTSSTGTVATTVLTTTPGASSSLSTTTASGSGGSSTVSTSVSTVSTVSSPTTQEYYECDSCYYITINGLTCPSDCSQMQEGTCGEGGFECLSGAGSTTLSSSSSSSSTTPTSTTTVYACGQTIPGCYTSPPESDCPDSCPLTLTKLQGCPTGSSYQCGSVASTLSSSSSTLSTTSVTTFTSSSTTTTIPYDDASLNNTQSSITVTLSGADKRVFCAGVNPGGISSISWTSYAAATDLSIGNTTSSNACGMGGASSGQVLGAFGTQTLDHITLVNSTACNSCSTEGDGWVAQNTHETVFILYAGVWASNSLSWAISAPSYCTEQFDTPVGTGTTGSQGFVALYACQPPIPLTGATSVSIPSVVGTDSIAISAVVVN